MGRTLRMAFWMSWGSALNVTMMSIDRQKYVHAFSKMWLRGRNESEVSASDSDVSMRRWMSRAASKLACVRMAPLGSPVVPEV